MRKFCGLIPLLLAVTILMMQPPAAMADAKDNAAIERLVANLGSVSRMIRQSAHKRLVEIGLPAVRPLRAAARADDADVRSRALTILKAIRDAREACVKELGKVPQPFKNTYLFISPNGERVAYILTRGGKEILVCDGKEGPTWDSIQYVGPFSRDGKRLPYQATKDGNSFIVFAGEEDKAIPTVGTGRAVYSADCGRIAYWVKAGQERWIVCDGQAGPHYARVGGYRFSPDGKRFAYTAQDETGNVFVVLDGKALKSYEKVGYMRFSPDSKRLAFTVKQGGTGMVVCDGKEGLRYPDVFYPFFSPDGKSLAYWARSTDYKKHFVIRDGKEVAQPGGEPRLAFSPDGRALACATYSGGELCRIEKEIEVLVTGHDNASRPVFSPDGRHIACALGQNMRWWVCVDGKGLAGQYDPESVLHWDGPSGGGARMILESPGFSADGLHVYWKGFRGRPGYMPPGNREHFIVCDGFEGPSHDGLWIPDGFRNHAERLRYVVRDGDRVRLMETAWPETITWQDAVE